MKMMRLALEKLVLPALLFLPASAQSTRTPVLVELFTSEGCSSCPPADALLAQLDRDQPIPGADIIALGEHVDYWNQLGWFDRFSSAGFSQRQNLYAARFHIDGPYTPQMVVDGTAQFVGNDSAKARAAIAATAASPKATLLLAPLQIDGRSIASSVKLGQAQASPLPAILWAALVQPRATTQVGAGENGGRRLNHVAIVRSLQRIGTLADASRAPIAISLRAPADAPPDSLRLVVFAQSGPDHMGQVLAVASTGPR
jgi:hypothetical protein